MTDHQPIFPALKSYDWSLSKNALCRPLITPSALSSAPGQPPAIPWVGYGYNQNTAFEFLSRETFPSGSPADHIPLIEQAAVRNLRERPVSWKIESVRLGRLPFSRHMKLLIFSDDFLAAEHIIDPLAMRRAAKLLRARQIVVGVPCRGVLVATKARQSKTLLSHFCAMIAGQYYQARTTPISPLVFLVEQGQIIDVMPDPKTRRARGAAQEIKPPPSRAGLDEIYLNAVISADRQTGREILHLLTGGPDFDQIEAALLPAFLRAVEQMLTHAEFSGLVRIILIPELTPRTGRLKEQIVGLQSRLQQIADQAKQVTHSGAPVVLVVQYGKETVQPAAGIEESDGFASAGAEHPPAGSLVHIPATSETQQYLQALADLRDARQAQTFEALNWLAKQTNLQALDPVLFQALATALNEILSGAQVESESQTRVLAIRVLAHLAGSAQTLDPLIFDGLAAGLLDADPEVRFAAEQALLGHDPSVSHHLRAALYRLDRQTNPEMYARLIKLLEKIEDRLKTHDTH